MQMSHRLTSVAVAAAISMAPVAGLASTASAAPVKSATFHTKVVKQTPAQAKAAAKAKKVAAAKKAVAKAQANYDKALRTYSLIATPDPGGMDGSKDLAAIDRAAQQRKAHLVNETLPSLQKLKQQGKGNTIATGFGLNAKPLTVNQRIAMYTKIVKGIDKHRAEVMNAQKTLVKANRYLAAVSA